MYLQTGSKKLNDKYKYLDVLPKVNNADMVETLESIEENHRSCCGVIRTSLAYIIWKNILVQIFDDYPKYMTPDDEMIARMLQLLPDKNILQNKQSAQSVIEHTAEYEIDNRSVYNILDQICKDTDLYPHFNQHKSNRDGRGMFYAIHFRWFGPNHVTATASQAEMVIQMPM